VFLLQHRCPFPPLTSGSKATRKEPRALYPKRYAIQEFHLDRLIVPVYLNQKLVFDLLAMLQGGISTVTAVTKTASNSSQEQQKISAGFGLSEAFSTLLKIDLSAEKSSTDSLEAGSSSSEERVHTPASLFYQLRNTLVEKKHLKDLSSVPSPVPGDFIEFEGTLKRNPIIETLDSFSAMMEIAESFTEKPQPKGGKNRNNQVSEHTKVQKQMISLSDSLKSGSTIDLTAKDLVTGHIAVITVEISFLNDQMMSDLVDGQFKVLGKVIRSITDESESISLLRKTALSKMPATLLEDVFGHFSSLGVDEGFNIPEMNWEIRGPAIQILPVAIYA